MTAYTAATPQATQWRLEPSVTFDALCLLGILTGDPFYLEHYQETYALFSPRLTQAATDALQILENAIKYVHKGIMSAYLTLYFSLTESETVEDLLGHVEAPSKWRQALENSAYYTASGWALFESIRPQIDILLRFLIDIEYEAFWTAKVRPLIIEKIGSIHTQVASYNILESIRRRLGFSFQSDEIRVYLLYYIAPHVIKIAGSRCLNDFANPVDVIVRTTVHELMHPPYNWDGDPLLRESIAGWQGDEFVMNNVRNHNPAFGYNTFEAYVEENVVQALDQVINESFDVAIDARERWRYADDGMHKLAVAIYAMMKDKDFMASEMTIRDFLIEAIAAGELGAGRVKQIYDRVYDR
jgi:hypothetical protein